MVRLFFHKTLEDLHIKQTDLSAVSGVSAPQISSFCAGRGIRLSTFVALLDGAEQLHPGAKVYFCRLLAGEEFQPASSPSCTMAHMEDFVGSLGAQDLSYLLYLISNRFTVITATKSKGKPQRSQPDAQLVPAQPN